MSVSAGELDLSPDWWTWLDDRAIVRVFALVSVGRAHLAACGVLVGGEMGFADLQGAG